MSVIRWHSTNSNVNTNFSKIYMAGTIPNYIYYPDDGIQNGRCDLKKWRGTTSVEYYFRLHL